jgi:hypothetical protein
LAASFRDFLEEIDPFAADLKRTERVEAFETGAATNAEFWL